MALLERGGGIPKVDISFSRFPGYRDVVPCLECTRLLREFGMASQAYSQAVRLWLNQAESEITASEYMALQACMNEAKIDGDLARLAIENHKRVHESTAKVLEPDF